MSKNKQKNKSAFSLSNLIQNNRFLMLISLLISFVLWVWVSVEKSPITQKVITDVPVKIDLTGSIPEQLNLQIFGDKEFKVDVTVSGKKYVLASLDKDDIVVTAVTNYVDSSGSKTLQLKYTLADGSEDFEIIGLSSSYIEVYFDTYKEVELPLNAEFTTDIDALLPADCILGNIVFSTQTVKVSGPATEINRISKAVAKVNLTDTLEKNTTVAPEIQLVTEDGSSLAYSQINTNGVDITMSIPVLKIVTLPSSVEFKNAPSNFVQNPLNYTVYPSQITAAVPIDLADSMRTIPVATIDFAEISNGINTFNISSNDIEGIVPVSATASKFKVTVDASNLSSKSVSVPASKVQILNADPAFNVTNIENGNLVFTVVGDAETLETINADSLNLTADLSGASLSEGTSSAVVTATLSNNKCWIHGKDEIKLSVKTK